MASTTIHLKKAGAMNSDTACGKRFMSLHSQETRMTGYVHKATCERCLEAIPAKFR